MLRFSHSSYSLSFSDYIDVIYSTFVKKPVSGSCMSFYESIFDLLTNWKRDFFNNGDVYIFLCQLLLGCRFAEVSGLGFRRSDTSLVVTVRSLKGTQDRHISYSLSSPLLKTFLPLLNMSLTLPSYKSYYRSLQSSNPNLYSRFESGHLLASHLPRHFFVQVLFYVCSISKSEVQNILGWSRDDTIESYIDQNIWKPLNVGGVYDRHSNIIGKTKQRNRSDTGSRHHRRISVSKAKKKVKQKE